MNFESMIIETGDSETKEWLKVEEATGEGLGWASSAP